MPISVIEPVSYVEAEAASHLHGCKLSEFGSHASCSYVHSDAKQGRSRDMSKWSQPYPLMNALEGGGYPVH